MERISMGIDIGGSHIKCQLYNLEKNMLVEGTSVRRPVDGNGEKEAILESWKDAIISSAESYGLHNLTGIGFAMPGPFDYPGGIGWFDENVGKFRNLWGVNIREELSQMLALPGNFPIRFLNDAASFAVGESGIGEAVKYERLIALTLGTGFGSTFIKNGLPVAGKDGIPDDGFLYHIPFQDSIADDHFSTRWFISEFKKRTGGKIQGVKEIAEKADNNSEIKEIFSLYGKNLGIFLSPWIKKFNAECIILGGNIAKSFHLFRESMEQQLALNDCMADIYTATLNEDAALTGAARLCDNNFYSRIINHQ